MNKKALIISACAVLIALIGCIIAFSISGSDTPADDTSSSTGEGVLVGVGDDNKNNSGDYLGQGDQQVTLPVDPNDDVPMDGEKIEESTSSICGHWASFENDIFDFVPKNGVVEAVIELDGKTTRYNGIAVTDNKTYITIDVYSGYENGAALSGPDNQVIKQLKFTVVSIVEDEVMNFAMTLKNESGKEYIVYPYEPFEIGDEYKDNELTQDEIDDWLEQNQGSDAPNYEEIQPGDDDYSEEVYEGNTEETDAWEDETAK